MHLVNPVNPVNMFCDCGKCHVCGEQMKEKRINQDSWLKGKLIVVESVPAGVCPQCGEKIVRVCHKPQADCSL